MSTVLAAMSAVAPRIFADQLERDRAPLLQALPKITELVSRGNAEHFMRAIVETVREMPDLKKVNVEAFREAVTVAAEIRDFILDRLEVAMRQEGARVDLVRAAQVVDGDESKEDDLVRLLARVHALQAFITTDDGANLLAGYKRAANILKKEGFAPPAVTPAKAGVSGDETAQKPHETPASAGVTHLALSYTPEKAETALIAALDSAEPRAAAAVAAEDFAGAMAALATLRAPIDAFFETVTVNDADADKRAARLALLARVRAAVHSVADFSRIEG